MTKLDPDRFGPAFGPIVEAINGLIEIVAPSAPVPAYHRWPEKDARSSTSLAVALTKLQQHMDVDNQSHALPLFIAERERMAVELYKASVAAGDAAEV